MNESKSIFQSKTAGANIATALVMVAAIANFDLTAEEAATAVAGVFTIVNIVMRLVSSGKVHVIAPRPVESRPDIPQGKT